MTLFAVLLTIFLDAAIIETDNFSVAGTEARDVSTDACMGIARVAGEFSALTLQQL